MVDLVTIGLVLGGAVLLFAGAALSVYGVVVLGGIVGGGAGYLLAPTIGSVLGLEGALASAGAMVVGGLVGIGLGYALLSAAVAAISFVVGSFVGATAIAPVIVDGAWYLEIGFALAVGIAAAFFGLLLTRTAMVVVTAIVGAAFASTSLTVAEFQAAQASVSVEPLLFDLYSPVYLGLVVLGILAQFGLVKLGYVRRIAAILPGGRMLPERGGEST